MTPARRSFALRPAATASARRPASQARVSPTRLLVGLAGLWWASPAAAEAGASVSLFSEASFRGYSLSEGRPVAILGLSYDHPSGAYAGASGTAVIGTENGIAPLSLQLNAGYAKSLPSSVVLDFGVTHTTYSHYASRGSSDYTEVYAGVSRKALSARVSYAPHYFEDGYRTLYGELDANFSPASKLNVSAHVGILVPLDYPDRLDKPRTQHDWRIGVARQVGPLSLHAFVTGGGPGRDYYRGQSRDRTSLVVGLSYPL